jgi:hypothetical protein
VFVDDWRSRSWVRNSFPVSLVIDVVGLTHTGLAVGQHHTANLATMSPWGNIVERLKMVLEASDVEGLVLSRGAAGDEVAWGISYYHKVLERPA